MRSAVLLAAVLLSCASDPSEPGSASDEEVAAACDRYTEARAAYTARGNVACYGSELHDWDGRPYSRDRCKLSTTACSANDVAAINLMSACYLAQDPCPPGENGRTKWIVSFNDCLPPARIADGAFVYAVSADCWKALTICRPGEGLCYEIPVERSP